jgi:hypothetical protein
MITVHGAKRFFEIYPGILGDHRNDCYFRHDWVNSILIESDLSHPRWNAYINESRITVRPDPANNPRRALLDKPASPCMIEVEDGTQLVRIWIVSATITARSGAREPVRDNGPGWNQIQGLWREYYGNGSFTTLGLIHFIYDTPSGGGHRYGAHVEYVGQVSPASISSTEMKFYIARRILRSSIRCIDSAGHPLSEQRSANLSHRGDNDTTAGQSGILNSHGELFDHDMPGAVMRNNINRLHDQHILDITFEVCVVIGAPPYCSGSPVFPVCNDPWPGITANGLAVSRIIPWRANYTATVTREHTFSTSLEISLIGSLG